MRLGTWLCAGLAAFAVACAGDPGPSDYGSPLAIEARTPAQGDTNVHVSAPIRVTFSRRLDPSTVVDGSVIVTGSGDVTLGKGLSLEDEDRTLVITLASPPTLPASITIVLTSALRDLAGDAFPQTLWTFSMPEWWEPFGIPPVSDHASVVLDTAGNPAIAWCGTGGIHVVRWSAGAWEPMGQVLSRGGANVCPPTLVHGRASSGAGFVDKFGVAWEEVAAVTSNDRKAYVAIWDGTEWRDPAGGPVSTAAPLVATVSAQPLSPTLSFTSRDSSGWAYAAARVGTTVQAWLWASGATAWTALGTLNSDATRQASAPSSAYTSGFGVAVAWTERLTSGSRDLYATALSSGTATRLGGGAKLNATGRDVLAAVVGSAANPLVAFSYRDTAAGTYGVQVVQVGGTRVTTMCPGPIADDASWPVGELAMANGPDGTLLALTERDQIRVKHCDGTGAWLEGTPASANAGGLALLDFAGTSSIPTVAYVDRGPPPPPGVPPRVPNPDQHLRIKQPNR